jgi:hypothetical protein
MAAGLSFLRGVRFLVDRSHGTFLSLEGGRRIESLRIHLELLEDAAFCVENIRGPRWTANNRGPFARWLVECKPASRTVAAKSRSPKAMGA